MKDQQKEQIRFNTEMLKVAALLFIAIGGGIISLILSETKSGGEIFFIAAGMIAETIFIRVIYVRYHAIQKMINDGKVL